VNTSTRAALNDAVIRRHDRAKREVVVGTVIIVALCAFVWFGVDLVAVFGHPAAVTVHAAPPKAVARAAAPVAATPTVDIVKLQAPCPTKAHVEGTTVVWFCDDGSVFYTRLGR
jgi:hypothetical protein